MSDLQVASAMLDASRNGETLCAAADGGSNAGAHDEIFAINSVSKGHLIVTVAATDGRTTAAQDALTMATKCAEMQGLARMQAERIAAADPSEADAVRKAPRFSTAAARH